MYSVVTLVPKYVVFGDANLWLVALMILCVELLMCQAPCRTRRQLRGLTRQTDSYEKQSIFAAKKVKQGRVVENEGAANDMRSEIGSERQII